MTTHLYHNKLPMYRLGWIVYFISYIGRYNYAAVMVIIGRNQGYTPAQLGLAATAFFTAYGAGQLLSGFLGDRLNPKMLILIGLIGSGISNLLMGFSENALFMLFIWGMNGLFCTLLWPPMVKLLNQHMPAERLRGALLSFQYCTALATFFTYIFTSVISFYFNWRIVFFLSSFTVFIAALLWVILGNGIDAQSEPSIPNPNPKMNVKFTFLYIKSGLALLLIAVFLSGFLKDGILTWVPKAVTDTFGINPSLSVLLSAVLPLSSIVGVLIVKRLGKIYKNDDIRISKLLFMFAGGCMAFLFITADLSPILTIAIFTLADTFVFGLNSVMTTLIPQHFAPYGRVATVAGVTNSFTYLGSASSGWGIGTISSSFGWGMTYAVFLLSGIIGVLLSQLVKPLWRTFSQAIKKPSLD